MSAEACTELQVTSCLVSASGFMRERTLHHSRCTPKHVDRNPMSITSDRMRATSTKDRGTLTTITARQRHSTNQSSTPETCYLRKHNRACPFRKAHAPNPARPAAEPRGKAAVGVWGTALPGVPCCCMAKLYIATFTKPSQLRQILLDRIPSCYALGAARVNASISHFHESGAGMSVIDIEWFSSSALPGMCAGGRSSTEPQNPPFRMRLCCVLACLVQALSI